MTFPTIPWPWRLWLLACLLCVGLGLPGAARANVDCSATVAPLNFGAVNVSNPSGAPGSGTVSYSCTNWSQSPTPVTLCLDIGNPSWPGVPGQPVMQGPGQLRFQLYVDAALSRLWVRNSSPLQTQFTIPGSTNNNSTFATVTGSFTYYGMIQGNQAGAPAGTYSASFYNTVLGFLSGGSATCQSHVGDLSGREFSLDVAATIGNACTVSASSINLGTVSRTTGNAAASGAIVVNCPNQTAYNVGLLPSNGDVNGAGLMSGTGTNTDKVPYQLRSGSAVGPIWGNTATSTSTGNGVAGTGNGSDQSLPVYATVGNTNFNADTYKDTVRVFVNY